MFGSYPEGSPGPDGIPFLFYHKFWVLIKNDLLKMFEDFQKGNLELFRLNFAAITLIPKEENAKSMRKFRPISLLNCSFKIFSKVLTTRMGCVCQRLISSIKVPLLKEGTF